MLKSKKNTLTRERSNSITSKKPIVEVDCFTAVRQADLKNSKEMTIKEFAKMNDTKGSLKSLKSMIKRESINMDILIKRDSNFNQHMENSVVLESGNFERIISNSVVPSQFKARQLDSFKRKSVHETVNCDFEILEVPQIIDKENDYFGEKLEDQRTRLKKQSIFGSFETFTVFRLIVKSGEDLRQEQFATQLIDQFYQIFQLEKVKCWINPYEIMSVGTNVGIIECVPNSTSIDCLKKQLGDKTLSQFFSDYFALKGEKAYKTAIKNFAKSLAGYSLVCYFLAIKDRHNGNILLDDEGHIIHIDFGFMLSNAPGKGIKFETAPFKLTAEFVEVLGGVKGSNFKYFRKLLQAGFMACKKHFNKIFILVNMMYSGHGSDLPCFVADQLTLEELQKRFFPREGMDAVDYLEFVDTLLHQSCDNWRTDFYDRFQYWVQGIKY